MYDGQMTDRWPPLPYEAWKDTYATLHMWMQIVGKIALKQAPPVNHSWGIAFRITARGISTPLLPYGERTFSIEFDLVDHALVLRLSDGTKRTLELGPRSVADFYASLMEMMKGIGLPVKIWPMSVEVPVPVRLDTDTVHHSYDPVYANRVWSILAQIEPVFNASRCEFVGKCSPVHFFWGSFDLAVSRFSGRVAPPRPPTEPAFMREAYSHEEISHGFWPGNDTVPNAVFYGYAAPEPDGFKTSHVEPRAAYYHEFGEFMLPYDAVRAAPDPPAMIRQFIDSTYQRAATLAHWDRAALERTSSGTPSQVL